MIGVGVFTNDITKSLVPVELAPFLEWPQWHPTTQTTGGLDVWLLDVSLVYHGSIVRHGYPQTGHLSTALWAIIR